MPVDTPDELLAIRADAASIVRRRDELVAEPLDRRGRGRLFEMDRELIEVLDRLRIDPCDASPDVPLVLLPVRVQTKLVDGTLLVRVTPDELHVDSLARTVTEHEAESARTYWRVIWRDAAAPAAWGDLVEAVGGDRAGWVARSLAPVNLDSLGTGDPDFPDSPSEVASGTVARCLPDRFVVTVSIAGRDPITEVGARVPRDLPISPIALADEDVVDVAGLRVAAGSEWSVDFAKAKKIGLGIEVTIPREVTRIESVVVVGTRSSVSEDDNARDLAELLVSHAYTDGLGLVSHGTPTNNADAERSPYRAGATAGVPATSPIVASDEATAVARLLGIDPVAVESLLPAGGPRSTLQTTQRNANTALWWATWEPVLHVVDGAAIPAVTPATIESARVLHRDDVRGAGHSSALRIGPQPYGILPVTDLNAWRPRRGETTASLVPLIDRVLRRWSQRAGRLPHVGPGDAVSDEQMLEMLGTSPVSTAVRARPAVDGPQVRTLMAATGISASVATAEAQLARAIMSQYSVEFASQVSPPAVLDQTRRIALPLVSERDAEVIAEILADRTPKVDSVLQALLEIAWDEAKEAQFRSAPSTFLPPLLELLTPGIDVSALAHAAVSTAPIGAAVAAAPAVRPEEFFAAAAQLRSTVHFDGQPTEAMSIAAIEPVAEARTSLGQVALDLGDTPQARWLGAGRPGGHPRASSRCGGRRARR